MKVMVGTLREGRDRGADSGGASWAMAAALRRCQCQEVSYALHSAVAQTRT